MWKLRKKQGYRDLYVISQRVRGLTEKISKTQQTVLAKDNKMIKLLHKLYGSRERKN